MLDSQLILSLITGIFVGGAAGYLGSLMISKRMALVGDALGHVALPGMGLSLLWGINVIWGALAFLIAGVFIIYYLGKRTRFPTETLVGIIFVLSLALGFVVTPDEELLHALVGDISHVSALESVISIILSVFSIIGIYIVYSKVALSSLSEELAAASNINFQKHNLIYLLLVALIVALGVKIAGSLLVGALVIVPAAASRNISKNLLQYSLISAGVGILSAALGIILSQYLVFSAGPLIVLTSIAIFIMSFIFRRREY